MVIRIDFVIGEVVNWSNEYSGGRGILRKIKIVVYDRGQFASGYVQEFGKAKWSEVPVHWLRKD